MSETSGQHELWYARHDGVERGPFPRRTITEYLLLGRLRESDAVSQDRKTWVPIARLPHLIPEVMRSVATDDDRARLRRARLQLDERLADRRRGKSAPRAVRELRRGERRRGESIDALEHRAHRLRMHEALRQRTEALGARRAAALLTAVFALLIGVATWYGSDFELATTRDCAAAPAPGVNWNHCDRSGARLAGAPLNRALLNNARLRGADLANADLRAADLRFAELSRARLDRARLAQANLRGAVLREAQLVGSDLTGADLSYADLRGAALGGARLEGARLGRAIWIDGRTCADDSRDACR